jgi:hypothetical protein
VFFEQDAIGMARPDQALFERLIGEEAQHLDAAETLAQSLGISFNASGATEPGESLARKTERTRGRCAGGPGRSCTSPPTAARCPAASPLRAAGYENYTLGDATQAPCARSGTARPTRLSRRLAFGCPAPLCANCGLRWSL